MSPQHEQINLRVEQSRLHPGDHHCTIARWMDLSLYITGAGLDQVRSSRPRARLPSRMYRKTWKGHPLDAFFCGDCRATTKLLGNADQRHHRNLFSRKIVEYCALQDVFGCIRPCRYYRTNDRPRCGKLGEEMKEGKHHWRS